MNFFENIGHFGIKISASLRDTIYFSILVLARMFNRRSYTSATKTVLINQIYFTSVQILPAFLLASVVFGSLLIGIVLQALKGLGLSDYIGHVIMGLIVTEFSPLFTVLLITLRSASAINAEIAVMKVNRELDTLEAFHIDVINYLLVPRIINGIVSIMLLSSLFSVVVLISGILFSGVIFGMGLDVYINIILNSANFSDIVIALLKCALFGFFVTLIPIRFGLRASAELTSIPIAVSNGMVNVFAAIIIIEVLLLITRIL